MKCFHHRENDSIGVCNCCGKAVCETCVKETQFGLACGINCEDILKKNDAEKKYLAEEPDRKKAGHIYLFFAFALIAIISFFLASEYQSSSVFFFYFAAIFIITALAQLFIILYYRKY